MQKRQNNIIPREKSLGIFILYHNFILITLYWRRIRMDNKIGYIINESSVLMEGFDLVDPKYIKEDLINT